MGKMAGQQITISIKQIGDRSHLLKDKASKIGIESQSWALFMQPFVETQRCPFFWLDAISIKRICRYF